MKRIMKRTAKALLMVCIAIGVGVAIGYAEVISEDYFVANQNVSSYDYTKAEMDKDEIHFSDNVDYIRFGAGADNIYMAADNDHISMGAGSDKITFYGQSGSTESIYFNSSDTSYIQYDGTDDDIEIKSATGDVIITLGD